MTSQRTLRCQKSSQISQQPCRDPTFSANGNSLLLAPFQQHNLKLEQMISNFEVKSDLFRVFFPPNRASQHTLGSWHLIKIRTASGFAGNSIERAFCCSPLRMQEERSVHFHQRKTGWPLLENWPRLKIEISTPVVATKPLPFKNQRDHIYHRNLCSVAPISFGKAKFFTEAWWCTLVASITTESSRFENEVCICNRN